MAKEIDCGESISRQTVFLLSPANASGVRGRRLLGPDTQSPLAQRLRQTGAPLGEVYQFISSLYFRGKLEYARHFANPPGGVTGVHIITGAGLMLPETVVTLNALRRISAISIDADNPPYRSALDRDLLGLKKNSGRDTDVILLGSIATSKYLTPLLAVFGDRLLFPQDFAGRGDMSRGSLLLKCCVSSSPLAYLPAVTLAFGEKNALQRNGDRFHARRGFDQRRANHRPPSHPDLC